LTRLADGQVWHYVTDHLGTPQEMYDQDGEIVWAADFSAYGLTARSLAQEVDNPIRFPGQYHDEESGLHYNRFRYYDPQVGRYINQDPIGFNGGSNLYSYAYDAPSVAYDPTGLFVPLIVAAAFVGRGVLGGGLEIGVQTAKQVFRQIKENWMEGHPLMAIDLDCVTIDWADVSVSAAIGTVAPGLGATRKSVLKSVKTIKNLSGQSANTVNRFAKLQRRINVNKSSIKRELAVQGVWQSVKQGGMCVFNEERKCED
jgi:type VI secretion system secreted protein VgrG